jgi:hypothetical protein
MKWGYRPDRSETPKSTNNGGGIQEEWYKSEIPDRSGGAEV